MSTIARALDQFFTRPDIASSCLAEVRKFTRQDEWFWVEPSAGSGAFLEQLPNPRIGLDIVSLRPDIAALDYLDWVPGVSTRRIAVVGNPLFGKNASLARRFFDHSARFADLVAFILPRTFEKPLFVNRLDRRMHLVCSKTLPDESFEFRGEPYAVPTVFQIWERRQELRPFTAGSLRHGHFDFVPSEVGDFAFQRVGARAGLVSLEGLRKSPQSHYFLRSKIRPDTLFDRLKSIDWNPIKMRTAGNPSIGKAELVGAYQAAYG